MKRKWANILIVGSMIAIIVLLSVIYIPAKVEANENKREQADMELLQKVKVAFESVLENDEAKEYIEGELEKKEELRYDIAWEKKVSFDLLKKWDVPVYNAVTDNLTDGQVFQAAVNGNTEVSLYVYYDKELNVKVQFVNNSTGDIVKGKYINKEMEIV
jgi:hypothetical protein